MSDITYVGKKTRSFESSPEFDGYTRVVIIVSEDVEYSSGVETGRTLSLECPWGTQTMADNILANIQGFKYQPYTATDAILDPAAELGDGITVNNVYGGIYTREIKFGRMCRATVSAPSEEELDHEYPYVSKQERKVTRQLYNLSAELKLQAGLISMEIDERKSDMESIETKMQLQSGLIEAKVSKTGGSASSFGWELDDSSWTIKASSRDILKATKDGLEVYGKITATSGKIGGFAIEPDYLSYNNQTWGGTNTTGIYIGPSGIQLGKNFKVDASGNLTAASGKFTGNVYAGNIQYGGDYGTLSGSALTGSSLTGAKIASSTIGTSKLYSGINTSLGYADYSNGVFGGWNTADYLKCSTLYVNGKRYAPMTLRYTNSNGTVSTATVLGTQD